MATLEWRQYRIRTLSRYTAQVLLYGAYVSVILSLILGIVTWAWLWQVKDWGITVANSGRIVEVRANSAAAQAGVRVGDTTTLDMIRQLQEVASRASVGEQVRIPVWRQSQVRQVTLRAANSDISQLLERSTSTMVGLGFVLMSSLLLIARRRQFRLWLLFLCTQTIGLFLISEGPRGLHVEWSEVTSYALVTVFPALVFHFHTLFPRELLGRARRPVVRGVYGLAGLFTGLNLLGLDNPAFDTDLWTLTLRTYLILTLLACVTMLLVNYRSQERQVRRQLTTIVVCAGAGLLLNAGTFVVAYLLPPELRRPLENLGVLAALLTPVGYVFAMLRYNVLIDGILWRRWLIRTSIASTLFAGGMVGSLLLLRYELTLDKLIVLGLVLTVGSLTLGVASTVLGESAEDRLLRGRHYADLLDYATRELERFRALDEFVQFFVQALPERLRSTGAIVYLVGAGGELVLQGATPRLHLVPEEGPDLAETSAVRSTLEGAGTLIRVTDCAVLQAQPLTGSDQQLLATLQAKRMALLMPLMARQQPHMIGLVALGAKETDEAYSRQEMAALQALARSAAAAAENVLLWEAQQQQVQELWEERESRMALARQVNAEQERTRKNIARDLHDRPVQELAVIMRALTAMREEIQTLIGECEERVYTLEAAEATAGPGDGADVAALLRAQQLRLEILLGEDIDLVPALSPERAQQWALESRPTVEGLVSQANQAVTMLREICNNVHPGYLSGRVTTILRESIARWTTQYPHRRIALRVSGEEPQDIPDERKVACKEIAEQAIHNAMAHGTPTAIRVSIEFGAQGAIRLEIVDDGGGFTPPPPKRLRALGHHGIANMAERAELAGGEFQLRAAVGQGTHVTVNFPGEGTPGPAPGLAAESVRGPGQAQEADKRRAPGWGASAGKPGQAGRSPLAGSPNDVPAAG